MTQLNQESLFGGNEWTGSWSQLYTNFFQNWSNLTRNLLFSDNYVDLWNQYIRGVLEAQQLVQKFNQTLLQAWGIPTHSDSSTINRQLYEIYNRLDELEARLSVQESATQTVEITPEISESN